MMDWIDIWIDYLMSRQDTPGVDDKIASKGRNAFDLNRMSHVRNQSLRSNQYQRTGPGP